MRINKPLSRSTQVFIGLIVLYLALSFILPANPATVASYHMDPLEYHYLLFIVRLPIVAVWAVAFYSYRSLHHYTELIKDTVDGSDFATIETGMRWIAWGWPIPAIVTAVLNAFAHWYTAFLTPTLVITNYMYVVISFMAFNYIFGSSYRLALRAKEYLTINHVRFMLAGLVIFGITLCYLVAHQLGGVLTATHNAYRLPGILVWTTIVAPYLFAWFVGIFGALQLIILAQHTPGIIYRQALQFLAIGLVVIIVSLCMLQYFRSVVPRTGHFNIGSTLITSYLIYAVNAVGSILLTTGAKRLKRIEDV